MDAAQQVRLREQARSRSREEQWAEAIELWTRLAEINPVDGRIWDGLAEARMRAGDFRGALLAYEKVRAYGVYDVDRVATFRGVTACLMANCHAALGEIDAAFAELGTAAREGFANLDRLEEFPHLVGLRDDARFVELFGVRDASGLPRVDGWRTDLRLLAAEAHRRRPIPFSPAEAERFDRAVESLEGSIPDLTDAQILVGLHRLITMLDDGHAAVEFTDDHPAWGMALPVLFYRFAEGLFVTSATPPYEDLIGAQVTAIDGRAVDRVLAELEPLTSGDNEQWLLLRTPELLRNPALPYALGLTDSESKVTLTTSVGARTVHAEADDRIRSADYTEPGPLRHLHERNGTPPLYLKNLAANYWFEHLPEQNLVYFQFNRVADDPECPLEAFSDQLARYIDDHAVDSLVVDLRWNHGGNTFLLPPLLRGIAGHRRLGHDRGLFMITGRRTYSAAGNAAKFLQWLAGPNLTVLGEPPGCRLEFIGETVPFMLPYSKLRCNISNLYWQGTTPLDRRRWIAPDVFVPPTFEAYHRNLDPVLDAVLTLCSAGSSVTESGPDQ